MEQTIGMPRFRPRSLRKTSTKCDGSNSLQFSSFELGGTIDNRASTMSNAPQAEWNIVCERSAQASEFLLPTSSQNYIFYKFKMMDFSCPAPGKRGETQTGWH